MKTVAIYGFAPQTRGLIEQSTAEEVWSLNNFYSYGLKEERVTRTFEMHELWQQYVAATRSPGGVAYWNWILEEHKFPIYMHKVGEDFAKDLVLVEAVDTSGYNEIELGYYDERLQEAKFGVDFFERTKANIVKYPMDEVMAGILPPLEDVNLEVFPQTGSKPYFSSSMDYMVALAIHEEFDRIEFYGIELREHTEWAIQKAGMEYWVAMAIGRGIPVLIPKISVLVNAPLYGLGEAQMIPIQVPEALKKKYVEKMDYWRNTFNFKSGEYTSLMESMAGMADGEEKEKIDAMAFDVSKELEIARTKLHMYEGAANAMTHMIDVENLKIEDLSIETVTKFEEQGKG